MSSGDTVEPPAALRTFLDLFQRGEYWESHEVLEAPWRESGSAFYQGLILYASAWVHWERGNAHGVDAQLRKTLERLGGYPDAYLGIDLGAIQAHCAEVRSRIADGSGWEADVSPLELHFDPGLASGGEAELLA